MRVFLAIAVLTAASIPTLQANTPGLTPEQDHQARQLLAKLGSQDFRTREKASQALVKMGRAIEPLLRDGMSSSDAEVRFRCRTILPLAMNYDLEKRIQAFLADKTDKAPLPGWEKFKSAVGSDEAARDMFASMHRIDTDMIEALDKDPTKVRDRVASKCTEFMMSRNGYGYNAPVQSDQIALLLYVVGQPGLKLDVSARSNFSNALHSLSYQPAGKQVLRGNEMIRKLVVKYLSSWTDMTIHSDVYLLVNLELTEGLDIARAMLKKANNQPWVRAMALGAVAKIGGKSAVPDLLSYLEDKGSCGTTTFGFNNKNVTMTTQLRDVALGLLVHVTGQNLNEYEFAYMKIFPGNFAANNIFMSPTLLGFGDDAARTTAQKKWKAWYEKNGAALPAAPKAP